MQVDRVKQAIHSGETVRVRYFGGSMPGAERLIKPIVVSGESVRAHCLQSGETKVFKLAMLEEVREGIPSELERSFVPPVQP